MASNLEIAGAQSSRPHRYAPLYNARQTTGLWTQRNPLRDAASSREEERSYGGRNDALIDGANVEISNRLTLVRRPGSSLYNSQTFDAITSFYSFRTFDANNERIRVMADTSSSIYEATGSSTKNLLFTKSSGAGPAYFQSVGNTLYTGDGIEADQLKWVQAVKEWKASTEYDEGDFIIDENSNIQVAWGGITCAITQITITNNVLYLEFDTEDDDFPDNLLFLVGMPLTLTGFSGASFLNNQTITILSVEQGHPAYDSNVVLAEFVHADYGPAEDSGTASSGSGTTGTTEPTWSTTSGAWTADGGQQWLNHGNNLEKWGIATPTSAPTVSQSTLPNTYPDWAEDTYYSTSYLIEDSNSNIQKVTTFGTTSTAEPTWNATVGGTTADGSVIWTNQGTAVYTISTAYAAGAYIVQADTLGNKYFYRALNAGTSSGYIQPFPAPLGSQITDNGIVWINMGIWDQWSSITSSTVADSFALIPLKDQGYLILGVGQNQAYNSTIALPTGYSTSRVIAWSTPGVGFSGSSTVTEGVYQSTASSGVVNSSFQGNFGGLAFTATSNWAAAAWSSDASVTQTSSGGFQYLTVTTAQDDEICICVGTVANGSTVSVPTGYSASQFINIVGMASSENPGHVMQGVSDCSLDSTLLFTGEYDDNDGNQWHGSGNVFGIFYKTTGGIVSQTVTNGTAILIPILDGGINLAVIQAAVDHGDAFGLPSGFGSSSVITTSAAAGWTASGDNHGHGWSCLVSGQTFNGYYADNDGNTWNMSGNILALAINANTTPIVSYEEVTDSNGEVQQLVQSGVSSSDTPAWKTKTGATTIDNNARWKNLGIVTSEWTDSCVWAYSYKNTVTGAVSTASPISAPIVLEENSYAYIQGPASTDPQVDSIVLFRSVQGGSTSTLFYLDEIPNPADGQNWSYYDETPDTELNNLIEAPIAHQNDPPPEGIGMMTYHLGRIWGAVANSVYFSGGPDTTIGNGNEAWPPANVFVFPSKVYRLFPCTLGLLVFTLSDVYLIQGTSTSAFYSVPFMPGFGLSSYFAFDSNGSIIYFYTTDRQLLSLDMSMGASEIGFPIGDKIQLINPADAHITWHVAGSSDKGLYVSDSSTGWYRLYPTPAPEHGMSWAPFATIVGGVSAVQSVEVSPGVRELLIGPKTSGVILKRDDSVFTDNGAGYQAFFTLGSIVLAQPGQIAELVFLTMDSTAIGSRPSVYIQLDEISDYSGGNFESLPSYVPDPPQLVASTTIWGDRYYISNTHKPALCRHIQIRIDWGTQTVQNEMLTLTCFGGYSQEL